MCLFLNSKIEWAEAKYKEKDKSICVRWERREEDILVTVDNEGFIGAIDIKGYICNNDSEKITLLNGKNVYCFHESVSV